MTDWETRYYEQQANFTESNGMLTQERDTYKADALRYRWLREQHNRGDGQWFVYGALSPDNLDADIDLAMGKT